MTLGAEFLENKSIVLILYILRLHPGPKAIISSKMEISYVKLKLNYRKGDNTHGIPSLLLSYEILIALVIMRLSVSSRFRSGEMTLPSSALVNLALCSQEDLYQTKRFRSVD